MCINCLSTMKKIFKDIFCQNNQVHFSFRKKDQDELPTALNGFLYSLLRNTRPQRRALVLSLLKQFDDVSVSVEFNLISVFTYFVISRLILVCFFRLLHWIKCCTWRIIWATFHSKFKMNHYLLYITLISLFRHQDRIYCSFFVRWENRKSNQVTLWKPYMNEIKIDY